MTSRRHGGSSGLGPLLALVLVGCSVTPQPAVPSGSGTYAGVTSAGQPIVLSLEQDGQAVPGHGTVDDEPVAIAGPLAWMAVGSLAHATGSSSLRELRLSPDGEELSLSTPGGEEILLTRQGEPTAAAVGPFNGQFQGSGADSAAADVVIAQSGNLLAGAGTLLGQPVGITGRATSASTAEGLVTFADESQARFEAELADDGQSITVHGLGAPATLRRL